MNVYLHGKRCNLAASALIGKGGEADIYQLDAQTVIKRYKEPSDPDYAGNVLAQQGASARLDEQQRKLPAFPGNLPDRVIRPVDLAYSQAAGGRIVGYTMRYLRDMEVLLRYGDRTYREQGGVDGNWAMAIFRDLHGVVRDVHKAGAVIGDFNDLNVLVDDRGRTYLVDADSMQFGPFYCQTFTNRFLDPLLAVGNSLVLARPHNQDSDWYAYLVMLCQTLLYTGPYGGVHRPKTGKRLQHDERVLNRLTFFDPAVIYPKPALPILTLPDALLDHLHQVFERDTRGEFPGKLLDDVRWTQCKSCAAVHARSICPNCAAPGAVKQTVVIRGTVTATRVFRTSGRIMHTVFQGGKLRYLYHEGGSFKREDGGAVLAGSLDPALRYRIQGDITLFGKRHQLFVLVPGKEPERLETESYRNLPMFDANSLDRYWIQNGQLVRSGRYGSDYIGDVLSGQTLFWAGERFGFGLYQAGQLTRAFTFEHRARGLNDQVGLPHLGGQLVDATCVFGTDRAWFMASLQQDGQLKHCCYVFSRDGRLLAEASAVAGESGWLGYGIRGRIGVGSSLYAATDDGIVRLAAGGGTVNVERTFPDTEPFVDSATRLVPSPDGIYTVSSRDITLLAIR